MESDRPIPNLDPVAIIGEILAEADALIRQSAERGLELPT